MPRACGLTRVTIVEDHALFAEVLDLALTLEGHRVHRVSTDEHALAAAHLCEAIVRSRPGVVLLDLNLGVSANGACVVKPLTQAGIAVVVVTGSVDRARWGEVLSYGARTVLPKSAPLNTILSTIRLIGAGQRVLPREERDHLLAGFHEERGRMRDSRARLESLTVREREILEHLINGEHVREIARASFVAEATVRTHVKSILAKLGVSSQLAAVSLALAAHGRLPVGPQQGLTLRASQPQTRVQTISSNGDETT
ncbi:MAG: response regulator transcription factor [Actinomycetota bacterium]|nr:response regulator transcription factor [Actinomycetota bacterium]